MSGDVHEKTCLPLIGTSRLAQVYNLIRGTNPSPGAWTDLHGARRVKHLSTALAQVGDGIVQPGWSDISDAGFTLFNVSAGAFWSNASKLLKMVAKQPAAEWASTIGLAVGDTSRFLRIGTHRHEHSRSDIEIAREGIETAHSGNWRQAWHIENKLIWFHMVTTRPRSRLNSSQPRQGKSDGKLILVTAINPTPAGEGKTTTTVGLGDGLNAIGKKAAMYASAKPRSVPVLA